MLFVFLDYIKEICFNACCNYSMIIFFIQPVICIIQKISVPVIAVAEVV